MPDPLCSYTAASSAEKLRRARAVLVEARRLLRADKRASLWECLLAAGDGQLEGWWARQMVQSAVGDLNIPRWEAGPRILRADKFRALKMCISAATPHQGGWRVYSSTPCASNEPVPGVDVFTLALRKMHRRGWKPTLVGAGA